MARTHGGGDTLNYGQRELYRRAREAAARRAAAWDHCKAMGVRAAMAAGLVALIAGVALMFTLGGCAASPRPARTLVAPGTAESTSTITENRGRSLRLEARPAPVPVPAAPERAGVLRVRVVPGEGSRD